MANKIKEHSKNSFKEEDDDSPKKSKNKSDKKEKAKISNPFSIFINEKFLKITGLFLLVISIYLLIAFVSYFITWFSMSTDDILTDISLNRILFDNSIEVQNWTGRMGAAISQIFIKNWFGIASFLFVINIFLLGFKWLTNITLYSLLKSFNYSLFSLIWLSVSLSFFFTGPKSSILGGIIGFESSNWLNGLMGKPGTFIVILFSLISFLIISFNIHKYFKMPSRKIDDDDIAAGTDGLTYNELAALAKKDDEEELAYPTEMDMEIANGDVVNFENVDDDIEPFETDLDEDLDEGETSKISDFDVNIAKGDDKHIDILDDEVEVENGENAHGIETEYDPMEDLKDFKIPSLDFLKDHGSSNEISINKEELEDNKNKIVKTLLDYSIKIDKIKATIGPTITLYEIVPAPGIRISKIKNLEDDIALSLAALGIRIIAPIPGRGTIGIEVPNQKPEVVSMRTVLASEKFQNFKGELPVALGKTISNETFVFDLTKMPHLLMAGATGQGKSVGLNAVITSILYKKHPSQVKFVMVDPKKVELSLFSKIERHYLAKLPGKGEAIITDVRDVVTTLNSLCVEMDTRYDLLKIAQVRNIKEYNTKFIQRKLNPQNGHRYLPYIVLIIDEFADLIMTAGKEIESPIARLAQLARAIGIHLIIATQRPSVNIITGLIKANFPARIAFRVTSKIDSRTILDHGGADQLIGRGDMLFSSGGDLVRIQCAFVDTPEVEEITDYIGKQKGYSSAMELPEYEAESAEQKEINMDDRDELFDDAARVVVDHQQGSTSLIQRKLKLGYNRAGRIIDQLEAAGIVGPFEGSKAREVRISDLNYLEQFLKNLNNN